VRGKFTIGEIFGVLLDVSSVSSEEPPEVCDMLILYVHESNVRTKKIIHVVKTASKHFITMFIKISL
jgi:hypothetical protein